jgi:hypothetical protein
VWLIKEIRRLTPRERGSACGFTTATGRSCDFTARRIVELVSEEGELVKKPACRIHINSVLNNYPRVKECVIDL